MTDKLLDAKAEPLHLAVDDQAVIAILVGNGRSERTVDG